MLLLQYLAPYLYEWKLSPRVEKNGTKVTCISTKYGVQFWDVVRLLAPSTNLQTFGKLFGLQQAKAHFPFSILNSVDNLNRPHLPSEEDLWRSEISGAQNVKCWFGMREAGELFRQANCSTVGDYLKAYLHLDVDILYQAAQAWCRQLTDLTLMDFIECSKFTISSHSYMAGLKCLESHRCLGSFFPNNSQLYRVLWQGMQGCIFLV